MLAKLTSKITNLLISIAAAVLAIMMFLTAFDVALRYLLNSPMPGALELTEYMMAILIPFCILYCESQKGHVAVELIMDRFPKRFKRGVGLVTSTISVIFVLIIAWQTLLQVREVYTSNVTSAVLKIPGWPFVLCVAIGIGVFSLILFQHLLEIITTGK